MTFAGAKKMKSRHHIVVTCSVKDAVFFRTCQSVMYRNDRYVGISIDYI